MVQGGVAATLSPVALQWRTLPPIIRDVGSAQAQEVDNPD